MKLDKHNWMAPYNLGLLEESQGNFAHALSAYEKSIDINRGFPPSRFRAGRLYERTDRPADAIREYSRAFEIDPEMRDIRHNPLVADSRLLDRVSVMNYDKDLVRATRITEAAWANPHFRHAPVDRPVFSGLVDPLEPEPLDSIPLTTTVPRSPTSLPPRAGETRPQEFRTAPQAPPAPQPQSVQPTPVPAEPENPLMLRPRPPLPTPLPQ